MILPRKFLMGCLIVILLIVVISLSGSLYQTFNLMQTQKKVDQEIALLQKEKDALINTLGEKNSNEYLEEVARDKLLMLKPGEKTVILPSAQDQSQTTALPGQEGADLSQLSNIEKWQRLFLP